MEVNKPRTKANKRNVRNKFVKCLKRPRSLSSPVGRGSERSESRPVHCYLATPRPIDSVNSTALSPQSGSLGCDMLPTKPIGSIDLGEGPSGRGDDYQCRALCGSHVNV